MALSPLVITCNLFVLLWEKEIAIPLVGDLRVVLIFQTEDIFILECALD